MSSLGEMDHLEFPSRSPGWTWPGETWAEHRWPIMTLPQTQLSPFLEPTAVGRRGIWLRSSSCCPGKTHEPITKSFAEFPAFIAKKTSTAPVIDGNIDDEIWKQGIIYPFAFNQLNSTNQVPPAADDSSGSWVLLYQGDTVYGLVRRVDNKTNIRASQPHENDCVELFFKTDSTFRQMRALVGKKFDAGFSGGKVETAWNEDGTILEFAVQIPGMDLAGKSIGWNIALADNDGLFRKTQLYPVKGFNRSWQQQDLAELHFEQ